MGRPRNVKKCATCRKRKIKCDELKPACSQCILAGWPCPGYSRFAGNRNTSPRMSRLSRDDDFRHRRVSLNFQDRNTRRLNEVSQEPLTQCAQMNYIDLVSNSEWLSCNPAYKLQSELICKMKNNEVSARFGMLSPEPYLRLIATRIGRNTVLDQATKCICTPLALNTYELQRADKLSSGFWYNKALNSLQAALDEPKTRHDTDTLAAIVLLQIFEHSVNAEAEAWVLHAKGAIRLIEHRGPERFHSELDHAILEVEIGNIVLGCIVRGEDCFLSNSSWASVLLEFEQGTYINEENGRIPYKIRQLILLGIQFPGLVKTFIDWSINVSTAAVNLDASHSLPTISQELTATDLYARISAFRVLIRNWREKKRVSASIDTQIDVFDKSQRETLKYHLAFQCAASTFLITVNYMLAEMQTCFVMFDRQWPNRVQDALLPMNQFLDLPELAEESLNETEYLRFAAGHLTRVHSEAAQALTTGLENIWKRVTQHNNANTLWGTNSIGLSIGKLFDGPEP